MEINTAQSPYALLETVQLKNVCLTDGFWSDRQAIDVKYCRKSSQPRYPALAAFLLTKTYDKDVLAER